MWPLLSSTVAALLVLSGLACAEPPNALWGSISDSYSLEFDEVRVAKSGCTLRVDYIKKWTPATYVQCRLTIDTSAQALAADTELDAALFSDAVAVSRVTPTGRAFPDAQSGTLAFSRYGYEAGEEIAGDFSVRFDGDEDLHGRFDARLEDAAPGESCD